MRKKKKKYHKKKYQQTERVKETKKRIKVWDKIKTPEERKRKKEKTKNYQKYVHRGDTKIKKIKKWRKI